MYFIEQVFIVQYQDLLLLGFTSFFGFERKAGGSRCVLLMWVILNPSSHRIS